MKDKIISSLRLVDLLADLPLPYLRKLVPFTSLRKIRAGETIFCQGEPSPYCFGIISGQVTIQRVSRDANFAPKVLSVLGPGALFGEQALFKESRRTAMAIASQEGELVAIQGKKFRAWMEKNTESGISLLMGILQNSMSRLRQTSQELSLVYGVGRFLASEKPIQERLRESVNFVQASLEDVDELVVYQRSPYWEEYQALTAKGGTPESLPLPLTEALVRQLTAELQPVISSPKGSAVTALIPFLNPEKNASEPLLGFLKAISLKNPFAFNPRTLLLLAAVSTQITEALLRHRRHEDLDAQSRLRQSKQSFSL